MTPWLPVNPNYLDENRNVEQEREDPFYSLNFYKALMNLRNTEPTFNVMNIIYFVVLPSTKVYANLQYGRTEIREYADDHVIGVGRLANSVSTTTYVTLINFDGSDTNSFSIQQVFSRQTC